ncbi:alpha/beta fold hydrolase [Maritimibacter dapengensis]|uniref:Alpha/beta hydrolase n=1 Tax=Maritimibacter dapengensis TaxID=2836868 RepID=A0ABS6SZ32_9RHOB|nr:alpha/beta hydrolase [Maritimibacter dapengensis]MBV7378233.1 alpha/beta hydrolase [Maritimibacter dapengensis]
MKEPILLIPGACCDSRVFAAQIPYLSKTHVVQVAHLADAASIREMAADTIHNAPPRFALCGYDMGGMVAMEILRRVPERVTRLCLISTTPVTESPEQAAWREPQIVKAQAGRLGEAVKEALPTEALAPGERRDATMRVMQDMAETLGAETFVRHSRAMQRRPDSQKVLTVTRVPTLVMCGAHDTITSEKRHTFMAELIPYAELAVIDDAGHVPTLETPEKTNIALGAWMELPMLPR